jgi:hypothetical protein
MSSPHNKEKNMLHEQKVTDGLTIPGRTRRFLGRSTAQGETASNVSTPSCRDNCNDISEPGCATSNLKLLKAKLSKYGT